MSRVWAIYGDSSDTPGALISPPRVLVPYIGERSTTQAEVPLGYPAFLADTEICEWLYRIRKLSWELDYALEGNDAGDDWDVEGSCSGTLVSNQDAFTEDALVQDYSLTGGAQGAFQGLVTGSETVTINGGAGSTNLINTIATLEIAQAAYYDPALNPLVPYYYRTDTGFWLPSQNPSVLINVSAALGMIAVWPPPVAGGSQIVVTKDCTIHGKAAQVQVVIADFLAFTGFSLTITPTEWWPYADDANQNPIWNSATGAQLLPNTIRM